MTYNYDSDPDISTSPYTQYLAGRLASIHYGGANCQWVASQFGSTGGNNYVEMFAYTQAGKVINKRFRRWYQTGTLTPTTISGDLEAVYTWDQEGKMLTQQYPQGGTYTFAYDALGRATGLTDSSNNNLVSSVTYGPAGEVLTMAGTAVNETRTYNALGQLKTLVGLNGVNLQYNYSATANNGQIASQYDVQSGEAITYQYDQLKRLSLASSTQGWGQTFTYDGFGNLTAKNASSGSPPVGSYPTNPATNQLTSYSYDANGNQLSGINIGGMGYDVSNRMVSVTSSSLWGAYEYDPGNRRVRQMQQSFNGSTWVTVSDVYYFYGLSGKKIGTYTASVSGTTINWIAQSTQVFFKGRLITAGGTNQQMDVRGSVGKYYPYGENRGTPPADSVQFATYTGDSVSGLDYAVNRYYAPGMGRFASADPYRAASSGSADPPTPASWNRYSYSLGDAVNFLDPLGLYAVALGSSYGYDCGPPEDPDPFCYPYPVPPPIPSIKLTVQCSTTLYAQKIPDLPTGYHTFIAVSYSLYNNGNLVSSVTNIIEGVNADKTDPSSTSCGPASALLNGCWLNRPPADQTNGNTTPTYTFPVKQIWNFNTGNQFADCLQASTLLGLYFGYSNDTHTYSALGLFGPNSNSFTSGLLMLAGVPGTTLAAVEGTAFWNYGILLWGWLTPLPYP